MAKNTDIPNIPDLVRIENVNLDGMQEKCMEMTHAVYPHDKIYGPYCTIEEYINCPPEIIFEYLADCEHLGEWTYSTRDMKKTEKDDIWVFNDAIGGITECYCKTVANKEAMTVDYHCAWDQGDHLWMIYLIRVVPAQLVLNKPGSVVLWTNCHHPFYDNNPFPEKAPKDRDGWVGDAWDMFYAGHTIEMQNLKKILEFRHNRDNAGLTGKETR